jgi:hypothetical protein
VGFDWPDDKPKRRSPMDTGDDNDGCPFLPFMITVILVIGMILL